jgi:serine protease Do
MKIPAAHLTPAQFNDLPVHRGQWTIAIGNPYGLAQSGEMAVSVGIVSATERSLPRLASHENRLYSNLIQSTAQINPGSSGGPLFDLDGRVIGINTAVILPQKQTNGIGFAMPITPSLMTEMQALRDGHEIVYGYVGVMVSTSSARERHLAKVPDDEGVAIDSIDPEAPAAGVLKPGDVVYSFNGEAVRDSDQFVRVVGASPVDKPAAVQLSRDGSLLELNITPRKRQLPSIAVNHDSQRLRWRGMLLGPVPSHAPGEAVPSSASGVMVFGIDDASPARKDGISPGSVITAVDGHEVGDVLALQKLVNDCLLDGCAITTAKPQLGVAASR